MIDLEKLVQEFVFLRSKLHEIAECIAREEHSGASFMLGCLHNVCNNHAISIAKLIPPSPVEASPVPTPEEVKKDEPAV